jgi:membrane-associated phospholipid phosphatase
MSEKEKYLSRNGLLIIGAIALIILIVGIILYALGFNEEFYSESSSVRNIFEVITYLGDPIVFIVITAILYLSYNKKFAKNLALSLLITSYFNAIIKETFQDGRPPGNTDLSEDLGVVESSYGFPSGHSQRAVSFWGYASYEFKNRMNINQIPIVPIILSILIFLVAISRIIIGVHDLQDIIGGLLLGICILLAFIYLEPIISPQFSKLNFSLKLVVIVAVSLALFLIGIILWPRDSVGLATQNIPPDYSDNGAFGQVCGVLLGFGVGYILEQEYIKYDPSSQNNKNKIINTVIGLIIVFIVFLPLEYILEIDSVFYRFARYAIVGFLLAFIVPLICKKINK